MTDERLAEITARLECCVNDTPWAEDEKRLDQQALADLLAEIERQAAEIRKLKEGETR